MYTLSPEEISFLRKKGRDDENIHKLDLRRRLSHYTAEALLSENGNGRNAVSFHGEIVSTHTRNNVIIERIKLPQGLFRRIRQGDLVIAFTNLTESKHKLK